MDVKKIGLLGGRGYVGQEIFELVNNHSKLSITSVYSSSQAGFGCLRQPEAHPPFMVYTVMIMV